MKIIIETTVIAPLSAVWNAWVASDSIINWNFATDDWHCPQAVINLEEGGRFSYRMEAKDGSVGFDFEGTFTEIVAKKLINFKLEDNRIVTIEFSETDLGVRVVETFEAESENAAEQQKQGWQNILNNFKRHVESS